MRAAALPSEDPVRWRFRALKQAIKCLVLLGRADEACGAYEEMLELARSGQIARAPAERKLASLLDHVAAAEAKGGRGVEARRGVAGRASHAGKGAEADGALAEAFAAENALWASLGAPGAAGEREDADGGDGVPTPPSLPGRLLSGKGPLDAGRGAAGARRVVHPAAPIDPIRGLPRKLYALTLQHLDATTHERLCLRCAVSVAGLDAASGDLPRAARLLATLRERCRDARVRDDPTAAAVLLDALALSIRIAQLNDGAHAPGLGGATEGERGRLGPGSAPTDRGVDESAGSSPADLEGASPRAAGQIDAAQASPSLASVPRSPLPTARDVPQLLREASALSSVGLPHPRTVAVLREASGRLALLRGRWDEAAEALLEAFRACDETGSPAALRCLRCLVACAPLRASRANPFDSQETRHHRDAAAVRGAREMADAYRAGDVERFFAWKAAAERALDRDRALAAAIGELQRRLRAQHLARLARAHSRISLGALSDRLRCADADADGAEAIVTSARLRQVERELDGRNGGTGKRCGCAHRAAASATPAPSSAGEAPSGSAGRYRGPPLADDVRRGAAFWRLLDPTAPADEDASADEASPSSRGRRRGARGLGGSWSATRGAGEGSPLVARFQTTLEDPLLHAALAPPSDPATSALPFLAPLAPTTARERAQLAVYPARLIKLRALAEDTEGNGGGGGGGGSGAFGAPTAAAADAALGGLDDASLDGPSAPRLLVDELRGAVASIRPDEEANVDRWVRSARGRGDCSESSSDSEDDLETRAESGSAGLEGYQDLVCTLANVLETLDRTVQMITR